MCAATGLARSTYYYRPRRATASVALEQELVRHLQKLRQSFPLEGYRRLTLRLSQVGFRVNHKRVARLMRMHGLGIHDDTHAAAEKGFKHNGFVPFPDRYSRLTVTGAHQAWIADLTYVRAGPELVYVAALVDASSCQPIGYAISSRMSSHLLRAALHAAVRANGTRSGCIHHSQCTPLYGGRRYRAMLAAYKLAGSMDSAHGGPDGQEVPYSSYVDAVEHCDQFIAAVYTAARIHRLLRR
jgi:putative transposase